MCGFMWSLAPQLSSNLARPTGRFPMAMAKVAVIVGAASKHDKDGPTSPLGKSRVGKHEVDIMLFDFFDPYFQQTFW